MWPGQRFSLKVKEELVNKQSAFQKIQVFNTETYGRMLVLDGVIQLTERDEFSYQEMLTHVPLFAHAKPSRVLIVGGGDGGILREVLKHPCVEHVTMVEIDGGVIDVAKEYFRDSTCTHNFSDTRLKLIVGDGAAFLKDECPPNSFDIVLVDSSDPVGPASVLFENSFYKSIHRSLAPGGIMCNQGECLWLHLDLINDVLTFSKTLFEESRYFYTTVPTYPSGQIGFILNRKSNGPKRLEIATLHKPARVPEIDLSSKLRYYTPTVHAAAFVLPKFAETKLGI
jgi:spermidine synthase